MTLILKQSAIFSVRDPLILTYERSVCRKWHVRRACAYIERISNRMDRRTPHERALIVAVARGGSRDQTRHVDRADIERNSL